MNIICRDKLTLLYCLFVVSVCSTLISPTKLCAANLLFRSDFSNTSLTPSTLNGDQWWYLLKGGEYGFSWENAPQLVNGGREIKLQTLVTNTSNLEQFVRASIVEEGGVHGKVAKLTITKDDPSFIGSSRVQAIFNCKYNKIFEEVKFKFSSNIESDLKKIGWVDIVEIHNVNTSHRLSFYLYWSESKGYRWYTQFRDDANAMNLWHSEVPVNFSYDKWYTFDWQVEATGNGPTDGTVRVWIDGTKVCEQKGVQLGQGFNGYMPFKTYGPCGDVFVDDLYIWDDVPCSAPPCGALTTDAVASPTKLRSIPNQ